MIIYYLMDYIQLNPFTTEPLYRQLKSSIKKAILDGVLSHNFLLPSEHQVMEVFEVSSTVVKKAYQALEDENLIYRIRGKGTFVHNPVKIIVNLPLTFVNNASLTFKVKDLMASKIEADSPVALLFKNPNHIVKIKRLVLTNNLLTTYQEVYFYNQDRKVISQYLQKEITVKDLIFQQIPFYQKGQMISKHGIKKATTAEATFLNIEVGAPLHKIASYIYDELHALRFVVYTFIRGDMVSLRYDKKL